MTRLVREYELDKLLAAAADIAPLGKRAVYAAFNGEEAFGQTVRYVRRRDVHYGLPQLHRDFFSAASGKGKDLGQRFYDGVLLWKQTDRPSLPALAAKLLERQNLGPPRLKDQKSDGIDVRLGRAIMLTALRGEMIKGQPPGPHNEGLANAYHNAPHFGAVAVLTGLFLEHQGRLPQDRQLAPLGRTMQLSALLAAFAHDIDHRGGGNPSGEPFAFEDHSFHTIRPLLEASGIPRSVQDDIHVIVRTTSPNGPHDYLKSVMRLLRSGETPTPEAVDPERRFPELDVLCERPDLAVAAAMVHDADLYPSAAAGRLGNEITGGRLTEEFHGIGRDMDFLSDKALAFFLDTIVGPDGFSSPAARELGNARVDALRQDNRRRLELS